MKKIVLAAVIGAVVCGMGSLVWAESSVKATPAVQIIENEGDSDTYIGPVYFPDFYESSGKEECRDNLKVWSKKKMSEYLDQKGFLESQGGFPPAKHCRYACPQNKSGSCGTKVTCRDGGARGIDVESGLDLADDDGDGDTSEDRPGKVTVDKDDYYDLKDLSGEVEINPGYEESAKVLFSWTVRVEGNIPQDSDHKNGRNVKGISVWPVLCYHWHGTSYQDYEGGQVKTQLYIKGINGGDDYAAVGDPVEMTVPPTGESKVKIVTSSDPTLTGSYVAKPGDFGGSLPSKIEYKLKWANATALRIKSPKGQRNMVVTVMPLTEKK